MTRTQYLSLCSLVLVGAFAGGYAANRAIPVAHAQEVVGPQEIRATGFTLVTPQGKVEASLRGGPLGAELILNDGEGNPRAEVNPSNGFVVRDSRGRIVWASPRRSGIVPANESGR
jgi:hypothetical protein